MMIWHKLDLPPGATHSTVMTIAATRIRQGFAVRLQFEHGRGWFGLWGEQTKTPPGIEPCISFKCGCGEIVMVTAEAAIGVASEAQRQNHA